MSEENQPPSSDEQEFDSAFGVLDDSIIAATNFSALSESLKTVQHLQNQKLFTQQLPALKNLQQGIPNSAFLSLHKQLQQDLIPLAAISQLQQLPALQLQNSIAPAIAATNALNTHTLTLQKLLPALQAIKQPVMPPTEFFQAIDNMQKVDYAVSEFANTSKTTGSAQTAPDTRQVEQIDVEQNSTYEDLQWTTRDQLELYYSFSATLLDEAIDASGVRDLSDKQRIGVCLTVAILIYASSNKHGVLDSVGSTAFLYAMLRDFSKD